MLIKKKTFALALSAMLIFSNTKSFAQEVLEKPTELFSYGPLFFLLNLLDQRIGLSFSYERLLSHHFSLTTNIMTGLEKIDKGDFDMHCISAGTSAGTNFYPFGQDLDKLYIGLNAVIDFQWYVGNEIPISNKYDAVFSLTPKIGWKSYWFERRLMIDIYAGYKFLIANTHHYYRNEDCLLQHGLILGLGWKTRHLMDFFSRK